jgi:hypothetical protein
MRILGLGTVLLAGVLSTEYAAAGYVEFRDGRFMKADATISPAGMVRIELNDEAWFEIPVAAVDAVERSGRVVYRRQAADESDVLLADRTGPSVAPLVRGVLRARRRLPDPASFRPSPFVLAERVRRMP